MIQTRIIAHRGSSDRCHENTMPAFAQAVTDGADGIEFDIRVTRDLQWIVHHDPEIELDCSRKRIASMNAEEVSRVRVGPGRDSIPTLAEFLRWSNQVGAPLVFDIKDTAGISKLIQTVNDANLTRPPLFSSFHRVVLKELERLRPDWQRGLIIGNPKSALARRFLLGSILRWSRRHRITSLHMEEHWVTPSTVSAVQQAGIRLAIWTVDDPIRMTLLSALGIDAIITNRPDVARITIGGKRTEKSDR